MKARSLVLTAFTLLVASGCSRSNEGENYVQVASEDAAMNEAIAKAKATADDFLRAYRAHKAGTKGFFLKKPYRTPSGSQEHMWIEVTDESEGVFQGVIANQAEETREVEMGQKVTLKLSEISDWKYQFRRY